MGMFGMLRNRVESVSTKMAIAFFVASAFPLVVGFVLIDNNAQSQIKTRTERHLVELVSSRERLLHEHINNIRNYAATLANLPSISEFLSSAESNSSRSNDLLVKAAKDMSATQSTTWGLTHHMFLVDINGTVVLSPPKEGWQRPGLNAEQIRGTQSPHFGESIVEADNYQAGLENPAVSGFFGFSERDHYHQLALHPVRDGDGNPVGMVAVEISIDTTQLLLYDQFILGETGRIYLTTDSGQRVVHYKSELVSQFDLSNGLGEAINKKQMVYGRFDSNQRDVQGIYLPSKIYPWVVCIEIDHNEMFAPVLAQRRQFAIVGGLILALCGLTALLVARFFGRPIKQLVESANAVAAGDLFREIEVTSSDEIGQLQSAVDEMRQSLKQQIDRLDHTVEERTTQLTGLNEQLKHDTDHDKLTGLANRNLLCQELTKGLEEFKADESHLISVLFFDFDRFKLVNDSLGHAAGGALLCSIADRFRSNLRKSDIAARIGGDEFVIMLSPVQSKEHAMEAAQRLLNLFATHHTIDGHEVTSTASIGLVTADPRYTTAEELIRDADAAMYQAKLDGKDRVVRFDSKMLEDSKFRLKIQEDLNRVLERDQLRVAYQPIVDLHTMKTTGFEALIRWEHPELGWVRPDQFIETAEDTGKIVGIGEWILERAVSDIQELNARFGPEKLSVNVNVAKRQLMYSGFMSHLRGVLGTTGIDPKHLKIEITESTIVDPRSGMSEVINEIRSLGVQIAMDDFGTGHSSLSLLHKFKFDVLKIDQSFIRDMDLNRDIGAVLHATIELAQNTGMAIVAEGVETESQVSALIAHGCDMVQGYYFAKPMFYDDVIKFLSEPQQYSSAA